MSRLQRFKNSMEAVYGAFSSVSDASTWTPPLKSGGHRGRYLWTDAFGVLNFLTLDKECSRTNKTEGGRYLIFAQRLIETVHDVLGRTRDGHSRLPGATDLEPLGGGLRIGKNEEYGPDGDGQYHHYLTMWMFALNRMSMATGEPSYNRLAVSLARTIHPRFFLEREAARPHMVWKVSMDLSRPLVASEGNLDPIDGFVVFRLLQATSLKFGDGSVLEKEIDDYQRVMARKGKHFMSADTLDLGMTLWTAHWFASKESWSSDLLDRCISQLRNAHRFASIRKDIKATWLIITPIIGDLLDDSYFETDLRFRLAFREFGTCLGIGCLSSIESNTDLTVSAQRLLSQWEEYLSTLTPDDLRPITMVMYSTALIPGGKFSLIVHLPLISYFLDLRTHAHDTASLQS